MLLHHADELVVRLSLLHLSCSTSIKESPGAGLRLVGPQMAKGFFEQMRLKEIAVGSQNLVERRPGLART